MANWELLKIARNTSLSSSSGSELIHLPRANNIGMLYLTIRGTNGSGSNAADDAEQQTCQEAISRIEVFSGGEIFFKMNGYNTRNVATYEMGALPFEYRSQVGAAVQESLFPIYFNCDPADPDVILPAVLMDSLDLEFDYTFTEDADAGFASSGFYYDLYAYILPDDGNAENKMIRVCKQKDSYTTAAAGEKKFDLTIDPKRMMRRLYVDCYEKAIAEGVDITDMELLVNSDRLMINRWDQLQMINAMDCRLNWRENMLTEANSTTDVIVTRVPDLREHNYDSYGATNRDDTEYITSIAGDSITMTNTDQATGALSISSDVIPAFALFDFDRDHSRRWLLSQNLKNFELVITDAAAGGAVKIYEESLVKPWWL